MGDVQHTQVSHALLSCARPDRLFHAHTNSQPCTSAPPCFPKYTCMPASIRLLYQYSQHQCSPPFYIFFATPPFPPLAKLCIPNVPSHPQDMVRDLFTRQTQRKHFVDSMLAGDVATGGMTAINEMRGAKLTSVYDLLCVCVCMRGVLPDIGRFRGR